MSTTLVGDLQGKLPPLRDAEEGRLLARVVQLLLGAISVGEDTIIAQCVPLASSPRVVIIIIIAISATPAFPTGTLFAAVLALEIARTEIARMES